MIVLAATTSTQRGGVAVVRGAPAAHEPLAASETLALVEYDAADDHAEKLFRALDEAVRAAGVAKADLGRVACDVGPGSFTGTRAGTAALASIAWSLGAPAVGVGSLEAMAFAARAQAGSRAVLTLLDARRDEVFGAVYGAEGVLVEPFHRARSDEAFLDELRRAHDAVVVGGLAATFPVLRAHVLAGAELPSARIIGEVALARAPTGAPLTPVYVRAPDAKTIEERERKFC